MSWFSSAVKDAGDWLVNAVEDAGDWLGGVADNAWNWISENVSGLPLKFFSVMGTLFPSQNFWGAQYFTPSHSDPDVNALMTGSKWSGTTITYSLPDSRGDYEWINPSALGFQRLSSQNEDAVHIVMASVAGYVNTGVSYAGRDDANIQVAGFQPGSVITRSHGYYPGVPVYSGDTWLKTGSYSNFKKGTAAYLLTMHELGHSLGLKHPHDSARGLPRMSASRDSTEYTVMSYNDTLDAPQTFMQYDIAALQAMYGADFTSNSGNTSYRWNSTTGEMYIDGISQGMTEKTRIFLTIWDGGGNDTYDMSNYSQGALIDLAPGKFSRFSQSQLADKLNYTKVNGNIYNAFQYNGDVRSLIENAIGGAGNDKILGNRANNLLQGMDGRDEILGDVGNDTLQGGAGDDSLLGGSGADLLDGGAGYDFASYYSAAAGVVANLSNRALNTGEAAGDSYSSIEALAGSQFNDTLTGNWDGNNLYGHDGNDRLVGLAGRDYIVGGGGDDVLEGGADGDWLIGGAGTDFVAYTTGVTANLTDAAQNTGEAAGDTYEGIEGIYGSNFADKLTGNALNNTIYGGWGEDMLSGLAGNDYLLAGDSNDNLIGGAGPDVLDGGNGFDYAEYHTATSGVVADLLNAWRNTGDAAGDSYVSIEGLTGSAYNDELAGNHASNELYGNGGDDMLEGRGGADWLYGGAGYDFASYLTATAGVRANLAESWRNTGEAYGDVYNSIEALNGSQFGDVLVGNAGNNNIYGQGGNDELIGGAGADFLSGGLNDDLLVGSDGSDTLNGGSGADLFRFDAALSPTNVDWVQDFTIGSDRLQLSRYVFTAFQTVGEVSAWQFTIGAGASTSAHRLIYNNATGAVSYDADGVGGAAQMQFATIGKYQALSASDFALIWP